MNPGASDSPPAPSPWKQPATLGLAIPWIVTAGGVLIFLTLGARQTDDYQALRHVLHAGYVAALVWYLARTGPRGRQLPELAPLLLRHTVAGRWIPVVVVALLFLMAALFDDAIDNLYLLVMLASLVILGLRWRGIRPWMVIQGLALAAIAYLGGLPALENGVIGETAFYLFSAFVAPWYVAGALLIEPTGVGEIDLLASGLGSALRGFFTGCLLFVPLGLINAADGSPDLGTDWLSEWWMTLTLPFFSGIAEEAFWRLLLLPLIYLLLRPAFPKQPYVALTAAVLFSGLVFGLGHGRTVERLLTTGLLYGVPMATVFARRSFEHAVGAHYMVNFIPWVMAYLEN